jgi:quercetin dioxygenase-like cupin family protein
MCVGAALLTVAAVAQPIAQQRNGLQVLQQADISVPSHEAITGVAHFVPGASSGRHTHPGEMIGYIVSGSLALDQEGEQARVLTAGESFVIPAGVVHEHTNRGPSDARMFVTYIVDKSRARTSPAR